MSLGTCRLYNDQPAHRPTERPYIAALNWDRAVIYPEPARRLDHLPPPARSMANLTRGIFNGYLSPATRRLIKKYASTWLRSIYLYREHCKDRWDPGKPYPVMITLTLPIKQRHQDKELNRSIFVPFMQRLHREWGVINYLWRAEAQENGNLHWHVIIDKFIPAQRLQDLWNLSIDALDYRWIYAQETGSIYPPSTEVHGIKSTVKDPKTGKVREVDPVDYLLEYFLDTAVPVDQENNLNEQAKDQREFRGTYRAKDGSIQEYKTRAINGRVWGCSDAIKKCRPPRAILTNRLHAILADNADRRRLRPVIKEHATIYYGKIHRVLKKAHKLTARLLIRAYLFNFGICYPGQLPPKFTDRFEPQDPRTSWIDLTTFTTPSRIQIHGNTYTFPTSREADRFQALHDRYAE